MVTDSSHCMCVLNSACSAAQFSSCRFCPCERGGRHALRARCLAVYRCSSGEMSESLLKEPPKNGKSASAMQTSTVTLAG